MNRPTRRHARAGAALAGLLLSGLTATTAAAQTPIDPTIPTPTLPAQPVQTLPATADGCGTDPVGWIQRGGFEMTLPRSTQNGVYFRGAVHVWDLDGSQQGDSLDDMFVGGNVEVSGPANISYQSGHTYGWYGQTYNGTAYSEPTATCYFRFDWTPPSSPTTITNPDFPRAGSPGEPAKESGQPTTFTISGGQDNLPTGCTNSSAVDCTPSGLDHYQYALNDQSSWTNLPADANGKATLTLTPNWGSQNLYVRSVDASGYPSLIPAVYTFYVPWQLPGTDTMTLTGPANAPRAVPLQLSGQLDGGYHNPGQLLHVTRTDPQHPHGTPLRDVPLGTDGAFTIKDTPQSGGANTYAVSYAGDATYAPATASATIQVDRAATQLSLTTDATTYDYGARATVTAHLGATLDGRTVSVYAQPRGGARVLLRTGTVDRHGDLAVSYRLSRDTVFSVQFAGDSGFAPATATRAVSTRAALAERLTGAYGSQRHGGTRYMLFHHRAAASLTVTLTPAAPGSCLRFEIQRLVHGVWRTSSVSSCHAVNAKGVLTLQLNLRGLTGATLRIRAAYLPGSSATNAATWGAWDYLVVRP